MLMIAVLNRYPLRVRAYLQGMAGGGKAREPLPAHENVTLRWPMNDRRKRDET